MTDTDTPWEPPIAGTEAEQLRGALERLRATFRWKADGLDSAGLRARTAASTLTLGGLLKHLARVEDQSSRETERRAMGPYWEATLWGGSDDPEFASASDDTPEQLYSLWDGAVERSRPRLDRALSKGGLDPTYLYLLARRPPFEPAPAPLRSDRGIRPAHGARRPY